MNSRGTISRADDLLTLLSKYKEDVLRNYHRGLNKSSLVNYSKGSIRTGSEASVLYALIREAKYRNLIEIGTGPGFGTLYFAQALHDERLEGVLHTIDTNPETERRVRPVLKNFGLERYVRFHLGDSTHVVPALEGSFDFCLIDGLHSFEQAKIDFENVHPKIASGGTIAFHDAYPRPASSPGVRNVIEDIVAKERGSIIVFSEQLFDFFSFPEDIEDARRIAAKWRQHDYSYATASANPKELMCIFVKA